MKIIPEREKDKEKEREIEQKEKERDKDEDSPKKLVHSKSTGAVNRNERAKSLFLPKISAFES